jgi:O-succinylbenzoic acid--CoA ligase
VTALSIRAAAAEHPDRIGLVTAERSYTYADLALGAASAPQLDELVATPTLATLLAIYRALDEERPLALLHPRTTRDQLGEQLAAVARHPLPPGTLAVLFTSGSTGTPRGVILSRAAFLASAAASLANLGDRDDDRWLLCLPLAHAGGLTVALRALHARRPLILSEGAFDPVRVAKLGVCARATLASLVPTQLDDLLTANVVLPPWRAVLLGGAAASPPLLDRAAARGVRFLRTYGMTETFGQVATQRLADAGRLDAPVVPLRGVEVVAGTRVAPQRIQLRAPQLMTGYLGEPPLVPPLVTSDLGYLDEHGGVHVLGRADDIIITGGENVHPAQVEAAVSAAPGVAQACAFGVPDERWGALVACAIVPAGKLDLEQLHIWLVAHLPPQLRPRRLAVVDALPLLPTGKVDRRGLAERLRAPC